MFQKSLTVKDKDDILLLEIKALSKNFRKGSVHSLEMK